MTFFYILHSSFFIPNSVISVSSVAKKMIQQNYQYLFGPVPSRRLGRSLGLDIVPMKTCTQNCLYCQLGKDAPLTLERKPYIPTDTLIDEVRRWLADGGQADCITLGGSGEPTLHSELGLMLDRIKTLTSIPTAIITNGTLMSLSEVRRDCAKADVVLPSLDAGDAAMFARLNNPHPGLDYETFVEGLCQFRREYTGQIWLEVFFCLDINTDENSIRALARQLDRIRPDKIQLNTAVRPTTHAQAKPVPLHLLERIAKQLHPDAEVIADFGRPAAAPEGLIIPADKMPDAILAVIRRHPCGLDDLCAALSVSADAVRPALEALLAKGRIERRTDGFRVCQ